MRAGDPELQGSTLLADGTNFAIYSSVAESVELCFFDDKRNQTQVSALPECEHGVWHGFMPGCGVGQRYGYRVHGPFDPEKGLRCNPAKLLIDPYSRELDGEFVWDPAAFDFVAGGPAGKGSICSADSAAFVPLSVVTHKDSASARTRPSIPWNEMVVYECNLRGYTMRHPAVPVTDRGRFDGMRNKDVLAYIKALGITSIELMPVQAFADEHHLAQRGLRNFWGYNTIGFFAPMPRYGTSTELRDMVNAIHDTGLEVILDVAYNHTAEGGSHGPTISFRGIDNLAYYRTLHDAPAEYVNDTGCGNTVNADHPQVQKLILDSLAHFTQNMGVDGFRFDLATILGRHDHGFSTTHPLLEAISSDERLESTKLIAEPWDPGPGGYQLGNFPQSWAEWNDQYRDTVRKFWRGDDGVSGPLAQRMHGSADLFENSCRPPFASVNFITSHDGFTLQDNVSYEHRHNEANGEDNQDGHGHNYSCNYGTEGDSDDPELNSLRRRQRLNMLATLLLSQGTPMLLAGDEFGNSQQGNNNAYAQDNETGWLDWSGLQDDPEFVKQVRELIWLRRESPLLRFDDYVHGSLRLGKDNIEISWINRDGEHKHGDEWACSRAFTLQIKSSNDRGQATVIAIAINGDHEPATLRIPEPHDATAWRIAFTSCDDLVDKMSGDSLDVTGRSITLLLSD